MIATYLISSSDELEMRDACFRRFAVLFDELEMSDLHVCVDSPRAEIEATLGAPYQRSEFTELYNPLTFGDQDVSTNTKNLPIQSSRFRAKILMHL
jgi:hypothetical protein